MIRTILDMLATVVGNHKDWESHLRATCIAYNTSIQSTTGQSPFLMFGRRARIPVDLLCGTGETKESVSVNSYLLQQKMICRQPTTRSKIEWDYSRIDRKKYMIGGDMGSPSK